MCVHIQRTSHFYRIHILNRESGAHKRDECNRKFTRLFQSLMNLSAKPSIAQLLAQKLKCQREKNGI